MSWIRGKLADHVGDLVVHSTEEVILMTSLGTESSYPCPHHLLKHSDQQYGLCVRARASTYCIFSLYISAVDNQIPRFDNGVTTAARLRWLHVCVFHCLSCVHSLVREGSEYHKSGEGKQTDEGKKEKLRSAVVNEDSHASISPTLCKRRRAKQLRYSVRRLE